MMLFEDPHKTEFFLEGASLLQFRNDVRVPGDGSNINFRSLVGANPGAAFRVVGVGRFDDDSGWRIVVAPLSVSGKGRFSSPRRFDGSTFAAGVDTRGEYRFDSYRVTYWRRFRSDSRSAWRFGYTLKVRDAEVKLQQPGVSERFRNTGFVPLLHFGGTRSVGPNTDIVLDFDGLVAPQGSALDLGAFVRQRLSARVGAFAGVRVLYGGADNDDTFNLATFGYLTAGLSFRL
ncbi:hypothetical protein EON82_14235 [bacterium]|nr:MAG: hypothetical protein EON82_14235 [bacterium]